MPNIDYKGPGKSSKVPYSCPKSGARPTGTRDAQLAHDEADQAKSRDYPSKRGPEWLKARVGAERERRMNEMMQGLDH